MVTKRGTLVTIAAASLVLGACATGGKRPAETVGGMGPGGEVGVSLAQDLVPELREAGPLSAAMAQDRTVWLVYAGPPDCVIVHPDPVDIHLRYPPWQVRWQVADWWLDDHYWAIDFDGSEPGKEDGDPSLFPDDPNDPDDMPPRMRCQGNKAWRTPKPTGGGTWTYKVSVYECENGEPVGEPICEVDPGVIIWE